MALFNLTELRGMLTPGQRLIGLDPGAKVIGVALSDVSLTLASPYGSLPRIRLRAIVEAISTIARKEGAGGLVVGLPLSMDGSVGPAAQAARDWTMALSEMAALPAAMWDERLSSAAVNRMLGRRGRSQPQTAGARGRPGGGGVDAAGRAGRQPVVRAYCAGTVKRGAIRHFGTRRLSDPARCRLGSVAFSGSFPTDA